MKGNDLKMYVHYPCKNSYPQNDYFTFCFIFSMATYCTVLDLKENDNLEYAPQIMPS